jgi:hypothetical protein
MDFSANRLAALAGLASPEVRHEIVREQAEALNESAQARQAEQNESEVRQAVRRTIRKMVAEGALNLDNLDDGQLAEGYTDDELRALCHSKDHNCAVVVEHPVWGRGKPVYESHALPDDEGNVEWYDVQFKHGIEKKVMAEDVTILQMEGHHGAKPMEEDEMEEAHCMEDEMEEGMHPAEMEEMAHGDMEEGMHSADEATLYEMDGDMYMEMHGKHGAMKYMLVPVMEEGAHEDMEEGEHEMEEADTHMSGPMLEDDMEEGAHEMEEDMHSMQEQDEPQHSIMYKGVKYVQAP